MDIEISGKANIGINFLRCVCGHCGNTDEKHALIEFNFQENRVIYLCSKCKKENFMKFGKEHPPPYPKISIGR